MALSPRVIRHATMALFVLLVAAATPASAQDYTADRFDSRIEVLPGGALRVTETLVFQFESRTFREVFRELPARRTDGIDILRAAMDGTAVVEGEGPGHLTLRRRPGSIRVTWHFPPTAESTHRFELSYLVRGAVREDAGADMLAWRALPSRHEYRIARSTVDIELPVAPAVPPAFSEQRVGRADMHAEGTQVRIDAAAIGSNGWIEAVVRMPPGSVLAAPPNWQQQQRAHRALAPRWIAGALVTVAAGIVLLLAIRRRYDPPPHRGVVVPFGPALPDDLRPAEAGALLAHGTTGIEQAMAALFSLAERGALLIGEASGRTRKSQRFVASRRRADVPMAAHERVVLDLVFTPKGSAEDRVPLDKARGRLTSGLARIRRALRSEFRDRGLMDDRRERVRHQYGQAALILLLAAGALALGLALLARDAFGPWPQLVPLAVATVALGAIVCHAAHTPLSDEGVRRERGWRGFKAYLKEVVSAKATSPIEPVDHLLPYIVALGMGPRWSTHVKRHGGRVPAWFHAHDAGDSVAAFAAFVAYSGAPASGGGGGTGGGGTAAGGGSSGAH